MISGEDFLLGWIKLHKDAENAPWAVKEHDYDKREYVYMLCEYETENYTLISKKEISRQEMDRM
jgi:hypothetical protein